MLLHPPADSWPGYHGDYSGRRHSALTQITPQNVKNLALAWVFQTDQLARSNPRHCWSMAFCISRFRKIFGPSMRVRPSDLALHLSAQPGDHIGHRGVAMYKKYLFFLSPDAHLVSLNSEMEPCAGTLRSQTSPRVIGPPWRRSSSGITCSWVFRGISITSPVTSGQSIRKLAQPSGSGIPLLRRGLRTRPTGGMTWMTGTYDPDLNLVYWGTGNPTPVLNGSTRPGDDLYTCSIVALNPDTGKLAWSFQASPHDTHDWDAVETPVLVDGDFHGEPKKMLMQSFAQRLLLCSRPHQWENLLTAPFGPVNWSLGVDQARTSDSQSRKRTRARWTPDRAGRGRNDQLSLP